MSMTNHGDRLLERKRRIDAERKAQAILRNPERVQRSKNLTAILAVANAAKPAVSTTTTKEA